MSNDVRLRSPIVAATAGDGRERGRPLAVRCRRDYPLALVIWHNGVSMLGRVAPSLRPPGPAPLLVRPAIPRWRVPDTRT